jgi:hypothetical protein
MAAVYLDASIETLKSLCCLISVYVYVYTHTDTHTHTHTHTHTDMRRLTTGIRSEKCVVRRFRRCVNVILRIVYLHKPRLYSLLHT